MSAARTFNCVTIEDGADVRWGEDVIATIRPRQIGTGWLAQCGEETRVFTSWPRAKVWAEGQAHRAIHPDYGPTR